MQDDVRLPAATARPGRGCIRAAVSVAVSDCPPDDVPLAERRAEEVG